MPLIIFTRYTHARPQIHENHSRMDSWVLPPEVFMNCPSRFYGCCSSVLEHEYSRLDMFYVSYYILRATGSEPYPQVFPIHEVILQL